MESSISADIKWLRGNKQILCRYCCWSGKGQRIVEARISNQGGIEATKCANCGSLDLLPEPIPSTGTDEEVDDYLEAGAGIDWISRLLLLSDTQRAGKMLDIGCGYGFALDLARFFFGFEPLGYEPSYAGVRGQQELHLNVRHEYFGADSNLANDYNFILTSEVIEHLPDPIAFLQKARQALSLEGVLLITTPSAEIVSPGNDEFQIVQVISPGFHCTIPTVDGMTILLERAGFKHTKVWIEGRTVKALAANNSSMIQKEEQLGPNPLNLASWYSEKAELSPKDSALRVGALLRLAREQTANGDWPGLRVSVEKLRDSIIARYAIDVFTPELLLPTLDTEDKKVPWALPGATFVIGMLELLGNENPSSAQRYFHATNSLANQWFSTSKILDLDITDLSQQSKYLELKCLATTNPEIVYKEISKFKRDGTFTNVQYLRLFVDASLLGDGKPVNKIVRKFISLAEKSLSDSYDSKIVALDGLIAAALVSKRQGYTQLMRRSSKKIIAFCGQSDNINLPNYGSALSTANTLIGSNG